MLSKEDKARLDIIKSAVKLPVPQASVEGVMWLISKLEEAYKEIYDLKDDLGMENRSAGDGDVCKWTWDNSVNGFRGECGATFFESYVAPKWCHGCGKRIKELEW